MAISFLPQTNIYSKKISLGRRDLLLIFSAILSLVVIFLFPRSSYGDYFWAAFFLLGAFPAVITLAVLKEPFRNFGLSKGNIREGIILALGISIIFIAINYYVTSQPSMVNQFSLPKGIYQNFWGFLLFEIFVALPLHFVFEFFFRGFVMLGLEKKFGWFSVLVQAVLQSLLFAKKPWLPIFLVLGSSLVAGTIAYRSKSIYYSFVSMWIISVSLDLMLIKFIITQI